MVVLDVVMHDHNWGSVPLSSRIRICSCGFFRIVNEDGSMRELTKLEIEAYYFRLEAELIKRRNRSDKGTSCNFPEIT